MKKYIIYESVNSVGLCEKDERERYKYEKNVMPTRFGLTEISEDGLSKLEEILRLDKPHFIDIIKQEISEILCVYSN